MRDDLLIEVTDSKGKYCGHVKAQIADITDDVVCMFDYNFDYIYYI